MSDQEAIDAAAADAIVRDLAESNVCDEANDCVLCGTTTHREPHEPACPYGRAVKWCEENPA